MPEPWRRLTKPSSSSIVIAARIDERETVSCRASSGSDGIRSPGRHSPATDPRPQLLREAVAQRATRGGHGATTTLSASPARIRGNASGVSSSPMMSETTERMPPASAASMSSAATWSRCRDAYEPWTWTSL